MSPLTATPRPADLFAARVRAGYVDTWAELGRHLEICQLESGDLDLFGELIRSSA